MLLRLLTKCAFFMPDAALTPYPAYKALQIQYIAMRSSVGLIAILRLSSVSVALTITRATDNNLLDPFTTQVIFVITAKVDHAFRGDFQNAGRQGAYELTVV